MVSETTGGVAPIGWTSPATILIDQALNDYEVGLQLATHMLSTPHHLQNYSNAQVLNLWLLAISF